VSAALVTGGGRGVGKVVAGALAREGFAVAVVARTASEVEATAAELEGAAGFPADVTDPAQVERVVAEASERLGTIELLVNNAGSARAIGPAWEVDPDDWWLDVESSLRSALLCTRAVVPGMIERRRGRILNVSSYVATRPTPYLSGYAAAKAALASFSEGLAAALREHGIAVFTITPGLFRSALMDNLMHSEAGRRWLPEAGTGRWVEPERVERLVAFLASGRGDALSGRFLHALDDLDDLAARAEEIAAQDLFALRLRR
jgi:3-oxoacyl-[acyl-carrier protein] reductase